VFDDGGDFQGEDTVTVTVGTGGSSSDTNGANGFQFLIALFAVTVYSNRFIKPLRRKVQN
jgi:hypothetical protein